ncbi:MAG: N-methyl-L-tryptophan oxidase [Chloroflexaceae bacterium]|jgi:sarcosine oxidase|nr:N-methyl-L-tryptophan oxidase [Chloroflexaceae bacterium]
MLYDVIVLGLGGMGSATAYQLAARGKRVLGLERHTPAHSLGSSHGRSRIIRQAYLEDPAYVPLLLRAYELWEQIERETDNEGQLLTITGGLMMGPPTSQTVAGSRLSAETHGLAHEMLTAADIRRRFPSLHPADDVIALYEAKAGFLDPEACVRAHLSRAAELGAELHFEEPALAWEAGPRGEGVRVTTARGSYEAAQLIIAAGAYTPPLLADLGLPLEVVRQVLFWFEPTGGLQPFAVGNFPIYIWEVDDGISFYGFPHQPGPPGGVKVAYFYQGEGTCTPETIDRTVHPHEIKTMRAAIAERIPALNGTFLDAVTCMYTLTPDHHFIISPHPKHAQVLLASPCSGHGFKFCSVIGEVLADLALDGATRHPIALFDVGRFRTAQ